MLKDEELRPDAERMLKDLEETGDPFSGDDWTLVQILRRFLELTARCHGAKG